MAAATQKFAAEAGRIPKRLGGSKFPMADETPIRIGEERGYARVLIGEYGIKLTVAGSRGGPVLDLHCPHFHTPIVVGGYTAYRAFKVRQRCWRMSCAMRGCRRPCTEARKGSAGGSGPYSTTPRACHTTSATKICKNG